MFEYTPSRVTSINARFGLRVRQQFFWIMSFNFLAIGIITFFYMLKYDPFTIGFRSATLTGTINAFVEITYPFIGLSILCGFIAWRCNVAIREIKLQQERINAYTAIIKLLRR